MVMGGSGGMREKRCSNAMLMSWHNKEWILIHRRQSGLRKPFFALSRSRRRRRRRGLDLDLRDDGVGVVGPDVWLGELQYSKGSARLLSGC